MSRTALRTEYALYGAAFLLALLLRAWGAASLPLSDGEAELALQALALSNGKSVVIGPHPAYLALTTALMAVFGGVDWTPRFWPVLAGSLLVLLPMLFRFRLGRVPAVILAFALAVDPLLLGVSRTVSSLPLALLFVPLAAGLLMHRRFATAGIALGMALLSGPQGWFGLLGLGVATLLWRRASAQELPPHLADQKPSSHDWQRLAIFTLATIFFAGTLFLAVPTGLSAMTGGLAALLGGWGSASGASVSLVMTGLLLFELLPLVLGIWGGVVGLIHRNRGDLLLLIWFAAALLVALAYPARQPADLAWAVLPLWALAARQFARLTILPAEDRIPALGQAVLATVIFSFISATIINATNVPDTLRQPEFLLKVIGALLMVGASAWLISWGWSARIGMRGLALGIVLVLLAYSLSAAWDSAGLSGKTGRLFWTQAAEPEEIVLLSDTLDEMSQWGPVQAGGPDLVVVNGETPALRWALRDFERVRYAAQAPVDVGPALVISPFQPDLALPAEYRGQDFVLARRELWTNMSPLQWFRWMVFRDIPAEMEEREQIILWARTDLFPGEDPANEN